MGCVAENAEEPYIDRFPTFARDVLGWENSDLVGVDNQPVPDELEVAFQSTMKTLCPTFAVPEFDRNGQSQSWIMLIRVVLRGTDFDKETHGDDRRWQASPQARMERLLRETGVPKPAPTATRPPKTQPTAVKSLTQFMTEEQQRDMGIHNLSGEERGRLREFLVSVYQLGVDHGKAEIGASRASEPGTVPTSSVIESRINGEFKGWEGETIIKLMNGQIWQQTEYLYHYHYAHAPNVIVYKSGGTYKMKVDGVDKAVGVMQLE